MYFKKLIVVFSFGLVAVHPLLAVGVDTNGVNKSDSVVELVFTPDELTEMGKWKDKTFNDMAIDAMNGDRAALYMIGMSILTGATGLTIDVQGADLFLEKSASLGFPPAIKQMIHKYIEEENPFLMMVYSNLLISFGHQEFVVNYHEMRSKLNETIGVGVSREIEKIAALKKKLVLKNLEDFEKAPEKMKFVMAMSYNEALITRNDSNYTSNYWIQFSKFQSKAETEGEQFESAIRDGCIDFEEKYEVSRRNIGKLLNAIESDEKISEFQIEFLIDTKSAIRSVEKFKNSLESFTDSPNSNIKMIANEFCLLCKYTDAVLQNHYKFILTPNDFLESESDMNSLTCNTTQFKSQYLYIQKIFNELQRDNNQ